MAVSVKVSDTKDVKEKTLFPFGKIYLQRAFGPDFKLSNYVTNPPSFAFF